MPSHPRRTDHGPFRADQLREGDRYELSNGHPIYCAPSGRDHAGRNLTGAAVIETDPDVQWAGVDAGFVPEPGTLRAPDVAVAGMGDERGFIPGVPPLAVEYAGPAQDETELAEKIADLLGHGTRWVWVVRLVGPRRVEVHGPGESPRLLGPGELLEAPGILRNPVPVEALYDREAGHRMVLRNLLQREGYDSLVAIRDEGRQEGREEGRRAQALGLVLAQLERRVGALPEATRDAVSALPLDALETLALDLMDFTGPGDLSDWLARPRP